MHSKNVWQRADAPNNSSGVTLLELLVVMALASLLLAIVFPSVGSGLQGLELRAAAQRVAEASRYARNQAAYHQTTFALEIDSAAGTVSVADLGGRVNAIRRLELPASVHIERVLPEEQSSAAGPRRFFYSPDGAAPEFQIVLGTRARQMTVSGDPLTGSATVQAKEQQ